MHVVKFVKKERERERTADILLCIAFIEMIFIACYEVLMHCVSNHQTQTHGTCSNQNPNSKVNTLKLVES